MDKQLKARAALELCKEKEKHGDKEIQEQVEEEDGDWEDGGDASGGFSIKYTWISSDVESSYRISQFGRQAAKTPTNGVVLSPAVPTTVYVRV